MLGSPILRRSTGGVLLAVSILVGCNAPSVPTGTVGIQSKTRKLLELDCDAVDVAFPDPEKFTTGIWSDYYMYYDRDTGKYIATLSRDDEHFRQIQIGYSIGAVSIEDQSQIKRYDVLDTEYELTPLVNDNGDTYGAYWKPMTQTHRTYACPVPSDASPSPDNSTSPSPANEPTPFPDDGNVPPVITPGDIPPAKRHHSRPIRPWPVAAQPSFPPVNGPLAVQVLPRFMSMSSKAYNNSATFNVTADPSLGSWVLSVGPQTNIVSALGSRRIVWQGKSEPLPDGKYAVTVNAPSSGKTATDELIVDSTPPEIEKLKLTNIEDRAAQDQTVYTFQVLAKDPIVNGSSSELKVESACVSSSSVPMEGEGDPVKKGDFIEFKVKLRAVESPALSFQVGIQDNAGNFVNKKFDLSLNMSVTQLAAEPLQFSGFGPDLAYKTQANGGGKSKALVPKEHSGLPAQQKKEFAEEALERFEDGSAAAQFGGGMNDYVQKELLTPISIDNENRPFFYVKDPSGFNYVLGVAVHFPLTNVEVEVPVYHIPALVTFINRETGEVWLRKSLVVEARNSLLSKATGGMWGSTVIRWDGRNTYTGAWPARAGQYKVEVTWGEKDDAIQYLPLGKHAGIYYKGDIHHRPLKSFGVINNGEGRYFRSFSSFKDIMGSAGPGYEWHHIVEQRTADYRRDVRIQSMMNIVRIAVDNHRRISGYYSKPQLFTGSPLIYREFLKHFYESFDEQYDVGVDVMKDIGGWDFIRQSENKPAGISQPDELDP